MQLLYPILLASASPRRIHLLKQHLGTTFEVRATNIDEDRYHEIPYPLTPVATAVAKWQAAQKLTRPQAPYLILAADTMVFLGQKSMGKPKDKKEAVSFLEMLSNNTHEVITAYCLGPSTDQFPSVTSWAKAQVTFRKLHPEEIKSYVNSGSPFDKAGGYGYQDDVGRTFVSQIIGLESTVIGLPVELLIIELKSLFARSTVQHDMA